MMKSSAAAMLALLVVGGCSSPKRDGAGGETTAPTTDRQAAPPKIAYSFDYRFSLPERAITAAQDRHLAMCDRAGLRRCRLIEMHRSNGEGATSASLKLEVDNAIARPFGAGLTAPVVALGGSLTSSDVDAQDLARDIVDLEASARGSGDSATAARTELAQARGRVATSAISIAYSGSTSFSGETGRAFASVGSTVTYSIVALIYFTAAVGPWALLALVLFFAVRAVLRRVRRKPPPVGQADQADR